MQLFGAVLLAKMFKASLVEPEWADWDWDASESQKPSTFETLYNLSHFSNEIKKVFNVDVVTRDKVSALTKKKRIGINRIFNFDSRQCWDVWLSYERNAFKRKKVDEFLLGFLDSFKLTEGNQRLVNTILETIGRDASGNQWHAIHMRTEKDWFKHSQYMRSRINLKEEEEAYVSPVIIRDKFYATFGPASSNQLPHVVFIACDEKAQQENPFDIWRTDTRLFHKKDIVELSGCDNKIRSAVDFEICVESPKLIGTSRSSFLRLAALTRFARKQRIASIVADETKEELALSTYIYNLKSPQLIKRTDNGFYRAALQSIHEKVSVGKGGQESLIRDLFWHVKIKALQHFCNGFVRWGARKCGVIGKNRF